MERMERMERENGEREKRKERERREKEVEEDQESGRWQSTTRRVHFNLPVPPNAKALVFPPLLNFF